MCDPSRSSLRKNSLPLAGRTGKMAVDCDAIVIGAGLAGLSCAATGRAGIGCPCTGSSRRRWRAGTDRRCERLSIGSRISGAVDGLPGGPRGFGLRRAGPAPVLRGSADSGCRGLSSTGRSVASSVGCTARPVRAGGRTAGQAPRRAVAAVGAESGVAPTVLPAAKSPRSLSCARSVSPMR